MLSTSSFLECQGTDLSPVSLAGGTLVGNRSSEVIFLLSQKWKTHDSLRGATPEFRCLSPARGGILTSLLLSGRMFRGGHPIRPGSSFHPFFGSNSTPTVDGRVVFVVSNQRPLPPRAGQGSRWGTRGSRGGLRRARPWAAPVRALPHSPCPRPRPTEEGQCPLPGAPQP